MYNVNFAPGDLTLTETKTECSGSSTSLIKQVTNRRKNTNKIRQGLLRTISSFTEVVPGVLTHHTCVFKDLKVLMVVDTQRRCGESLWGARHHWQLYARSVAR